MKRNIIVVGGYGTVGGAICRALGQLYPGRVYAAGRSLEKAERFARSTNGAVLAMKLQLGEPLPAKSVAQTALVVMCLDQPDIQLAKACIGHGIGYIDITANGAILAKLEQEQPAALRHQATVLLSVGLAPGLTNLLVKRALEEADEATTVDISVMLSVGGSHGKAAIEWTVDQMNYSFEGVSRGKRGLVGVFTDGKPISFLSPLGWRKAYRFSFSDQQTLARTQRLSDVATRLCFDSKMMTSLLALCRATGLYRLLRFQAVRNRVVSALERSKGGDDRYAIKVDLYGRKQGKDVHVELLLEGRDQSAMTAHVATVAASRLLAGTIAPGVHHLDQWLDGELPLDGQLDSEERVVCLRSGSTGKLFQQASRSVEDGWPEGREAGEAVTLRAVKRELDRH